MNTTHIECGSKAHAIAAAIAQALGLDRDALDVVDDSASVEVLLGPDALLPTG